MPVLKNKSQGKYVNVNKGIVTDRELCLRDRGMLTTLLSLADNWKFSVAGLDKILPDGKTAISNSLNELQERGYLTREQIRGKGGAFGESVIEVHETPRPPMSEKRKTEKPTTDNPLPAKPMPEKQTQLNTNIVTNQEVIINGLNNQSIHQNIAIDDVSEIDEIDRINHYTEIIKENIEYEILLIDNPNSRDIIEEILNLIVDIIVVPRDKVRIGGTDHPYSLVKGKFFNLNMEHIQYVINCMDENTTKVRNIKSYLLTALYNAPNTINNYYRSMVKHDLYGGDM